MAPAPINKYELIDNDNTVIFTTLASNKLRSKKVYHITDTGILCSDLETFIDRKTAEQVTFAMETTHDK